MAGFLMTKSAFLSFEAAAAHFLHFYRQENQNE